MNIIRFPTADTARAALIRPAIDSKSLEKTVNGVLEDVRLHGDTALLSYTEQFDGVRLSSIQATQQEIQTAGEYLSPELRQAILQAAANIRKFHEIQLQEPFVVETMPGVRCWRKSVGIDKVGLYIPGGSAPLFSTVLMLGIPAMLAGCKQIVLCSPPNKKGNLHPAILFAAEVVGINTIFKLGGVQAIGALAYGTATVPKVYKIFGPGNQYVTCAKQILQQQGVAIDMPAGPSEVAVFADDAANASYIAADLLSQAEHGPDSQVVLVTTSEIIAKKVEEQIAAQLPMLSRAAVAEKAIANSVILIVRSTEEAMALLNDYAPEHLILASDKAADLAELVTNAGSVFLGHYSPESVGDYASGTNHTLPTNGYATAYSGVSVDSFVKKITFQQLTENALKDIAPTVVEMARAEGLDAHANAVNIRIS